MWLTTALMLARLNSRPVILTGLALFLAGLAFVVADMSAASLAIFLIGTITGGSAAGALVVGSLSAANRLAPPEARAQEISSYFVFAYSGLIILVIGVGVGVAANHVGDFRAVLGCAVALAVLCALPAVGVLRDRGATGPQLRWSPGQEPGRGC